MYLRTLKRSGLILLVLGSLIPLRWLRADAPFTPITAENAAQIQVLGSRLWSNYSSWPVRFSPDGKFAVLDTNTGWRLWNLADDTDSDLGRERIAFISPDWKYIVRAGDYSPEVLSSFIGGTPGGQQLA